MSSSQEAGKSNLVNQITKGKLLDKYEYTKGIDGHVKLIILDNLDKKLIKNLFTNIIRKQIVVFQFMISLTMKEQNLIEIDEYFFFNFLPEAQSNFPVILVGTILDLIQKKMMKNRQIYKEMYSLFKCHQKTQSLFKRFYKLLLSYCEIGASKIKIIRKRYFKSYQQRFYICIG
ncbi:unnamed protein product [Paramecium pentaurelia]|uniref:Uncharacterized protein n=1 Tax=Paramecium pentaurelia TaxID=43138 RepID=A0A8S1XU48_9CILI|nr:unnamed protein product [Paramecium pentaurelia]